MRINAYVLWGTANKSSTQVKNRNVTLPGGADREGQEKLEGLMDELRKKHVGGSATLDCQENWRLG